MPAYYNENDPKAAAWLRELIKEGHIAPGEVDERSIRDVRPADIAGFTQCHFFAGIGGWSLALRKAGWPDDDPVDTGSCPCQPFSAAGLGRAEDDPRHLWPVLRDHVASRGTAVVFGEQVASNLGRRWLAGVFTDLEALGYHPAAADLCAPGVGAPQLRQRLFWMAYLPRKRRIGSQGPSGAEGGAQSEDNGPNGWMGRALSEGLQDSQCAELSGARRRQERGAVSKPGCPLPAASWMGGTPGDGQPGGGRPESDLPNQSDDWALFDVIACGDGFSRRVEPGSFPLVDAGTLRNRLDEVRGAGNALNISQAQGFIEAVMEIC